MQRSFDKPSRHKPAGIGILAPAALAAAVLCGQSAPAQAQVFFDWWSQPTIVYERGYNEMLGRRDIRRIVAAEGYAMRRPLRRNGRVYVADVENARGVPFRLIIDGFHGEVVQRFRHGGPPRPPENLRSRRYSVLPEPQGRDYDNPYYRGGPDRDLAPPVLAPRKKAEPPRRAKRKPARRSKTRTASRPAQNVAPKAIESRPVAPPVVPPPVPAAAAPKPAKATAGRTVTPPETKRNRTNTSVAAPPVVPPGEAPEAARKTVRSNSDPAPKRSPVSKQKDAPAAVTAARSGDETSVERTRKPKVRFVKPKQKPEEKPAQPKQASRTILPPPAAPAAVKVPVQKREASRKPRVVYPGPQQSNVARPRVKGAPLDDPGKRRDIAKPVPVAPLQ
ncbi:MAG: hypothetical protein AB7J19_19655 [Beijerinckiaceae bacterium]